MSLFLSVFPGFVFLYAALDAGWQVNPPVSLGALIAGTTIGASWGTSAANSVVRNLAETGRAQLLWRYPHLAIGAIAMIPLAVVLLWFAAAYIHRPLPLIGGLLLPTSLFLAGPSWGLRDILIARALRTFSMKHEKRVSVLMDKKALLYDALTPRA